MGAEGAGLDAWRKRLRFRSWHRGTREVDLLLGPFADRHLARLDDGELAAYQALLEESDPDLFDWITGRAPPPPRHAGSVLDLLMEPQHRPLSD